MPARSNLGLANLELVRLADKFAEFSEAECMRVEIRREVQQLLADGAQVDPAVITILLGQYLLDHRHRRCCRLERLVAGSGILLVLNRTRKQVFGIDEPPAGLAKTFRCLLLAKAEYIGALLTVPGGKPREIPVRGHWAEAVEPTAVQQIHCIDDQSDIGSIFPVVYANCCCGIIACFASTFAQPLERVPEKSP